MKNNHFIFQPKEYHTQTDKVYQSSVKGFNVENSHFWSIGDLKSNIFQHFLCYLTPPAFEWRWVLTDSISNRNLQTLNFIIIQLGRTIWNIRVIDFKIIFSLLKLLSSLKRIRTFINFIKTLLAHKVSQMLSGVKNRTRWYFCCCSQHEQWFCFFKEIRNLLGGGGTCL